MVPYGLGMAHKCCTVSYLTTRYLGFIDCLLIVQTSSKTIIFLNTVYVYRLHFWGFRIQLYVGQVHIPLCFGLFTLHAGWTQKFGDDFLINFFVAPFRGWYALKRSHDYCHRCHWQKLRSHQIQSLNSIGYCALSFYPDV